MVEQKRPFGIWTAAALVVGSMIGAGIFVLPGQMAPFGWTGLFAWLAAALGAGTIALVIAELTRAMPEEPGLMAICGKVLGPLAGVVLTWSYWVSLWCATAVVATTAASYLAAVWTPLGTSPLRLALIGSAIVGGLTLLNLRGAAAAGRFQVLTTALKLMPLIAVVAILAGLLFTDPDAFKRQPLPSLEPASLTSALTLVFFAILSFEAASMVAERVRDPARNVVRATLAGLALTVTLYIVVCMGIIMVLPSAALTASTAPLALFVQQYWGNWAGGAVALLAAVSGIGFVNGAILLQGELPLTAARGGLVPASLAPTNRNDVAVLPMLIASLLSIVLMIGGASSFGTQVLDFMLRLTTASAISAYVGAGIAAIVLRKRPFVALLSIAFSLWVLYGAGLEAGSLGMALMAMGVPVYFAARSFSSAKSS